MALRRKFGYRKLSQGEVEAESFKNKRTNNNKHIKQNNP